MAIEVRRADSAALDGLDGAWDDLVGRSPMGTLFHRWDALTVVESHSDAVCHPLVGFKGQEPIGVFPVFELRKGPVTTAFSPPPGMGIPALGPVLFNHRKLKQRRFEKRNNRFIEACLDWTADRLGPKFVHVVSPKGYDDVRPFQWNDFDVSPRYTYDIDLSAGEEELVRSMSRDARKSIRNTPADAYAVERRGEAGLEYVLGRINSRYEDGDGGLFLDEEYVRDLRDALGPERLLVYVAEVDGRPASGRLTLHEEDRVTLWQGSPKPEADLDVPINDVLNWRSMRDGIEAGKSTCNFVGANTRHLCRYKSKYNPAAVQYYEIERGTRAMTVASDLYRRFS